MSTTRDAARAMRESFGLPDTDAPTEFDPSPTCEPVIEDVDPELIYLAQSVDSTARDHEARDATADAIEKAKEIK